MDTAVINLVWLKTGLCLVGDMIISKIYEDKTDFSLIINNDIESTITNIMRYKIISIDRSNPTLQNGHKNRIRSLKLSLFFKQMKNTHIT